MGQTLEKMDKCTTRKLLSSSKPTIKYSHSKIEHTTFKTGEKLKLTREDCKCISLSMF